jgi:hypothetical protein
MADPDPHAPHLQRQPAPAPRVEPHTEPRAKPRPAAAAAAGAGARAPSAATRVDTTRMAGLLLRATADTIGAALARNDSTRQARLVTAAMHVTSACHELAALSELHPIAWRELPGELSAFLATSQQLGGTLRAAGIAALDAELTASVVRLTASVGARNLAAATARSQTAQVPPLAYAEHVELARLAIAVAARQASAARGVNRSTATTQDEDRDALVRIVKPVQVHLATAADAALAIADSRGLEMLIADTEALSGELTLLAHRLAHTPRLPWHIAFASVFDTESQLRSAIGLDKKLRPYTGTIDPQAAVSMIGQKARPDPDQGPGGAPATGAPAAGAAQTLAYTDPQAAVNGIAVRMSHIFVERIEGVRRLKSDLEEPPPPRPEPMFELVIGLAANVVLSAVSGGLGALVADKLRVSLERSASAAATAIAARDAGRLSDVTRASLIESRVRDGALRRAVLADAAKDGTKRFFNDSTTRALAATQPHALNSARPLNAYTQHLEQVLRAMHREATILMTHVAGALGQLDLATLEHFAGSLDGVHADANQRQYDASLREWENIRARLDSPPFRRISTDRGDPNLGAQRMNEWGEEPIPGVLELGLEVIRAFGYVHTRFKYLVLRDGEAAAIRHLRAYPRRLPDTGMNRQYQLSFDGDPRATSPDGHLFGKPGDLPCFVKVGVGAKHGLQLDSLSLEELRLLKAFTVGPVTRWEARSAILHEAYDHIPKERAFALVREIIAQVDDVTTARLWG